MDVAGSVALVTGASSGIGAATARRLARAGATVIAAARREDRLAEVVAECRRDRLACESAVLDVTDREAAAALVAELEERHGSIDILVNNAGIPMRRHARELDVAALERVMDVNFLAAAGLALDVLPGMRARRRGAIVNVTSVSAYLPVPRAAAYGASKAALSRFSHGLAVDLAGSGVHVAVVSPGPIDTEIWSRGEEAAQYGGRLHPPEVVADAILDAVVHGHVHRTSPRRYGATAAVYPLLQRPLRWALGRYADARGAPQPRRDPEAQA